jgi:hypothetical protein
MGLNYHNKFSSVEKLDISVLTTDEVLDFQVVNNARDKCEYEVFQEAYSLRYLSRMKMSISIYAVTPAAWMKKSLSRSQTALRHTICDIIRQLLLTNVIK